MTKEPNNNNNQEPTEDPIPPAEDGDGGERTVPVSALQKQASDHRIELEALNAKLKQYEDAKAADEQKKLEEQGKWQEIAAKAQAEAAKEKAEAAKVIRKLALRAALAGARDEVTIDGLISQCPDDADPKEWAAQIKKDKPEYFTIPPLPPADEAGQGARAAGGSADSADWIRVSKDYQSGNPDKVAPATRKLLQYQQEHDGKLPPGDWS